MDMTTCFLALEQHVKMLVELLFLSQIIYLQEPFMHIDHDYNVNAAKIAKEMGISHYGLLSAFNAKPTSYFTYPRCKGLIEQDIHNMNFDTLSIFKPGLLNRGSMARLNEKISMWLIPSIPVAVVAKAMRIQAGIINELIINAQKQTQNVMKRKKLSYQIQR